jgi:hypothetical protein
MATSRWFVFQLGARQPGGQWNGRIKAGLDGHPGDNDHAQDRQAPWNL